MPGVLKRWTGASWLPSSTPTSGTSVAFNTSAQALADQGRADRTTQRVVAASDGEVQLKFETVTGDSDDYGFDGGGRFIIKTPGEFLILPHVAYSMGAAPTPGSKLACWVYGYGNPIGGPFDVEFGGSLDLALGLGGEAFIGESFRVWIPEDAVPYQFRIYVSHDDAVNDVNFDPANFYLIATPVFRPA